MDININKVKDYCYIFFGIILVAIAIEYFFAPNDISGGGVTGLAIIINNLFPKIKISLITLIANIILFTIAFIILGGSFGKKTLVSTIALSSTLWIIERFLHPFAITKDLIIATIFGTLMTALGMAIVFNSNSSTGGTDIIAKILNKYLNLNIGVSLLSIDFIITFFGMLVFGVDSGLYALLSVLIGGITIDRFIDGFNSCKEVFIISENTENISNFIINHLERGCTYLKGEGAFSGKEINVIYCIVGRNEFIKLRRYILKNDPTAFISVRESYEVLGNGFVETK